MAFTYKGQLQDVDPAQAEKSASKFTYKGNASDQPIGQQIGQGIAEGSLRALELPALALSPLEKLAGKSKSSKAPSNYPGRTEELKIQSDILDKLNRGERPSFAELDLLSEQEILPQGTPRRTKAVLQEMQEKIPKGGVIQEAVARGIGAAPFALGGPAALGSAILADEAGLAAKETAKGLGAGETGQAAADIAGSLGFASRKSIANLAKKPIKTASGLTELKAVKSPLTKYGIITPERKKEVLQKLDTEASKLSRTALEKHTPLIKEIEKGVNFEQKFEQSFGKVKELANKYKPPIEMDTLDKFFTNTSRELSGIPGLSSGSRKIKKEISEFYRKSPDSLDKLLKTYRENNKKFGEIAEGAIMGKKQREYKNFLEAYNDAIRTSIKDTFPKDSAYVKMFEDANKEYSQYMRAIGAERTLSPLLKGKITSSRLENFVDNPKFYKKLSMDLGKEGANEVKEIAKDLLEARKSIGKMSTKQWKGLEDVLPAGYFIADFLPEDFPGKKEIKGAGIIGFLGLKAKKGLGLYLSSPASRRAYGEAIKSIKNVDKEGLAIAIKKLEESMNED